CSRTLLFRACEPGVDFPVEREISQAPSVSWQGPKRPLLHLPGRELHIAFDRYQRHPECTRYLRLSRIAIDDQLNARRPECRQSALLMDKHRQMAVKVVYLAI